MIDFRIPSLLLLLAVALPAQSAPQSPQRRPAPPPLPLQFGYRDGAETIRIDVAGDDLTVTCNNQPLAKERMRRQGSRVLLYGPHYELTAQLILWSGGGSLQTFVEKRPMVVGFRLQVPSPAEVEKLGVDAMKVRKVLSVTPGLPAAKAGIVAGDMLLQLDGDPVVTEARLRSTLLRKKPGDQVRLLLRRGETEMPCAITLEPATAVTSFYEVDSSAAQNYVQGLRTLGGDSGVWQWVGGLGAPQPAPAAPPAVVHLDGKNMLMITPGGLSASASSSSSSSSVGTANGAGSGDDARLELQRLQQRLDAMERMLQKLVEMREKSAGKDGNSK